MADISILSRLINGIQRNVDLASNALVVSSIKVGGSVSNTELTKLVLDKLILINTAADADGTFDSRYLAIGATAADASKLNGQSASYYATASALSSVSGVANAALPSASFTDAAVTGKVITGFSSGAGALAGTDTILQAINKLDGNVAAAQSSANDANAAISQLSSGQNFREYLQIITGDAAPSDGTSLASVLPFGDDNAPQLVIGDFAAGQFLMFDYDGTPKLLKIYDDAGTLKVTSVGVTQPVQGNCYHVKANLPAGSDALEKHAIYGKSATVMIKIADEVWDSASGIMLGAWTSGAGVVGSSDSVLAALQKIDGNVVNVKSTADAALPSASFTDSAVSGKLITGYSSSAGVVAATDSILQALNKLNGNAVNIKSTADAALPSASFTDAAVTGKVITGFSSGAGVVAATDTILQALNKLNGNVANAQSDASAALAGSNTVKKTMVAGQSFSANTTYAVRMAMNGETAGRVYAADFDASVSDKFYVIGLITPTVAISASDNVEVTLVGEHDLGSSDTAFAAGEVGQPVHLKASGAWDAVSQISYTSGQASFRFGMVQTTSKILVGGMQINGVM